MEIIDTCGKPCPAPLILTKQAIQKTRPGDTLKVITDNETSFRNLKNYLKELQIGFKEIYSGYQFQLEFVVPKSQKENIPAEQFCSTSRNYVVVIKSDTMGEGDEHLGKILMRGFINALTETEQLPSTIILYNSGVKTALEGTDTADTLLKLEKKGVTIMACGTCVDFFEVREQLAVGVIGNMFQITRLMAHADHIIYP